MRQPTHSLKVVKCCNEHRCTLDAAMTREQVLATRNPYFHHGRQEDYTQPSSNAAMDGCHAAGVECAGLACCPTLASARPQATRPAPHSQRACRPDPRSLSLRLSPHAHGASKISAYIDSKTKEIRREDARTAVVFINATCTTSLWCGRMSSINQSIALA